MKRDQMTKLTKNKQKKGNDWDKETNNSIIKRQRQRQM